MRRHGMTTLATLAACLALLLSSGCATTDTGGTKPSGTAVGAGAGALGGAAIGGAIGGTRGAVAGGLLGALAGGLIGRHYDEQEKDRAQTGREYGYDPAQGLRLRIEALRANPAALSAGETVNVNLTYAVLTPGEGEPALVRETREILFGGAVVGRASFEVSRGGGTWRSTVPITLPVVASDGDYRVVASVETAAGGKDVAETFFRVRP